MIDLHCHSYYSDGIHSPKELIQKAKINGIKYLALTDHDTLDGMAPLLEAGKELASELHIINGIELSVSWKKHVIHILGLNLTQDDALKNLIMRQNTSRIERAKHIGEALEKCGLEDAYHKACKLAGHDRAGRPHFARALLNEGMIKDLQSGFKLYLGRGKRAYVPTQWISIEESVEGIRNAGGQAVIAHPLKYGLTRTKLYALITSFKEAGGDGLEVVSGDISMIQAREMAGICTRFDLLASTGSDFHGEKLSRVDLGKQLQLPPGCQPIWTKWNVNL